MLGIKKNNNGHELIIELRCESYLGVRILFGAVRKGQVGLTVPPPIPLEAQQIYVSVGEL